jgi:hypothetical protein
LTLIRDMIGSAATDCRSDRGGDCSALISIPRWVQIF